MRKKTITIILLLLALLLSSCKRNDPEQVKDGKSINLIYPDQTYASLGSVKYTVSADRTEDQVKELAERLSKGPEEIGLRPALNEKAELKSMNLSGPEGSLIMDFKGSYRKLSKTEEVLTRASIVETMTQLEGISYVKFTVEGEPLRDAAGNEVGNMIRTSFINDTGDEITTYARRRVTLYFTDRDGKNLVREDRVVVYAANTSPEKLVIQKLIEGPDRESGMYPTLAPDTGLLSIAIKDNICYVNFNAAIYEKPYDISEEVVVYSIVNTLAELPGVDKVQIAVEGVADGVLFDHMKLDTIYERNADMNR
ncbi:MAG: GerMN domain-containing protein [Lachnospiraceae bacterium]|nr:GerMN domain-containing protein [Lachnospiraceae bacterium]